MVILQNQYRFPGNESALRIIWVDKSYFTARSMDVFVTKLRKFLSDDPNIEIKNIHGSGFLLEASSLPSPKEKE